ncbi:MAG: LacI family DNA-binding transcriptional regulator, partial [Actinobacteria bacterium]|nr:LacI family DNA-binding transcriptional regulator [Actinomycetota bacterium]
MISYIDKKIKNITIKEIAKLAEVSTQTVSRVLNKKYDSVSKKTKEGNIL